MSLGKRLAAYVVMFALVAGVAELLCFLLAYRIAGLDLVDFRPALLRNARATVRSPHNVLYRKLYDPDLGWVYRKGLNVYGDPLTYDYDDQGARACARPFADTLISTYGDSFTHGDGVAGDETWSFRLGERLSTNVLNFGVGGYGTDQALLRTEKNCRAGIRTKVVGLGLCSENISRTLGSVRAFYSNDRCVPCATNGPKPVFRKTAKGWKAGADREAAVAGGLPGRHRQGPPLRLLVPRGLLLVQPGPGAVLRARPAALGGWSQLCRPLGTWTRRAL